MNMGTLFAKIMGFLVIVITLALAPTINSANLAISGHANVTQMIGMSVISGFGAPLIILGLLAGGGMFALAGVKGKLQGATMGDMLQVVFSVVVVIVALTFMKSIMDYNKTLMTGLSGFDYTLYSVIPLLVYLGIIAAAGWTQVSTYRRLRRGRRSRSRATGY